MIEGEGFDVFKRTTIKTNEKEEKQVGTNEKANDRCLFSTILDIVAVLSLIIGIFAAISLSKSNDIKGVWIAVGLFSALWWHFAAVVVDACHKYLNT